MTASVSPSPESSPVRKDVATTFRTPAATPITTHADLAECARQLHRVAEQTTSVDAVLDEVTRAAVRLITSVAHGGATIVKNVRHHQHDTVAATSHIPTLYGALENSHQEGPRNDAIRHRRTTVVHDFGADPRWPALGRALSTASSGHSCLAVPLITSKAELIGALTLFADTPDVIADADIAVVEALATHAALAVATAQRATQFDAALRSRDVIGQAKGMIMERFTIDADAAFGLLTKLSQDANIRVAEIATRLVSNERPPEPGKKGR